MDKWEERSLQLLGDVQVKTRRRIERQSKMKSTEACNKVVLSDLVLMLKIPIVRAVQVWHSRMNFIHNTVYVV